MTTAGGAGGGGNGTILEDDQQLYDWGIENRLDQYYQDDPNGEHYQGSGYYPRNYSGDRRPANYPSPPPAHQEPGYRVQGDRRIKEEPGAGGLDMSGAGGWNYQYGRKLIPPPSPGGHHHGGQYPPPFSLDANEAMKVERKRARNRIAASKCRMRKIEKIQTLDQQTSKLKAENDELAALANKLKEQVYHLQQELQWHVNNGCQVSDRANKAAELLTDFPLNIVPKDNMSMSIKENMSMSVKDNISTKDSMSTSITPVSEQTASPDSTTVSPVETGGI